MILRRLLFALIGLAIGIGMGLFIGWYAWPATFSGSPPSVLAPGWKNEVIWMAAQAFAYDGDLEAASGRLAPVFGSVDLGPIVLARAEEAIDDNFPPDEIGYLGRLAAAYGARSPRVDAYLNVSSSP